MSLLLNKKVEISGKELNILFKTNYFVYTNTAYNEFYIVVKSGYLEVSNINSFFGIFSFLNFEKNIFSFFTEK